MAAARKKASSPKTGSSKVGSSIPAETKTSGGNDADGAAEQKVAKTVKKTATKKTTPKTDAASAASTQQSTVPSSQKSDAAATAIKIKRPVSPYMFFCAERRPNLVAEKPELKSQAKEVARLLGKEWRELDKDGRSKFDALCEKDKKRYQREKEAAAVEKEEAEAVASA